MRALDVNSHIIIFFKIINFCGVLTNWTTVCCLLGVMLVKSVSKRELSKPAGSGADGLSEDSGRTDGLVFVRPPRQFQASHILCKYALVRSSAGAFSPVRSPQILISQVTVVDFQPVCAADITIQASRINLGVGGPFFAFPATAVSFLLLLTTFFFHISVVIKFHLYLFIYFLNKHCSLGLLFRADIFFNNSKIKT